MVYILSIFILSVNSFFLLTSFFTIFGFFFCSLEILLDLDFSLDSISSILSKIDFALVNSSDVNIPLLYMSESFNKSSVILADKGLINKIIRTKILNIFIIRFIM